MASSPAKSNDIPPEASGNDRNLAVTMMMRNPDANMAEAGDRATQICEVVAAIPTATADEEETSIAEYMEGLLRRARIGQGSNSERTIPLPTDSLERRVPEPAVPEIVQAVAVATTTTSAPSQPPECRNAMSEMRQLANASTRNTLHSQLGFRLLREMRGNGWVAIGSMVTSVVLSGLASSTRSPIFYAAVTAAVVAAAWVLKFFAAGRLLQCVITEVADEASTEAD
jgi:hypothetical protein